MNVPDYLVRGDSTYRLIRDHLGSVRVVVNVASGSIAQRMSYDEFGIETENTNAGWQPFGYAGGLTDSQTGLIRFGARDYDPVAGRWTAKDPIGFAGGTTSLYSYAAGDPINSVDVTGREIRNPHGRYISPEMRERLEAFNRLVGVEKDIVIISTRRPRNSGVGVGSTSQHVIGDAADFYVPGQCHLETAHQAIASGLFGGIGWYEEGWPGRRPGEGPHVHTDLRTTPTGRPEIWGYDRDDRYYRETIPSWLKYGGDPLAR